MVTYFKLLSHSWLFSDEILLTAKHKGTLLTAYLQIFVKLNDLGV